MKRLVITEMQDVYRQLAQLIDEGYLIHGTTKSFDKFNPSFIEGGCRGKEGYGFYFTDMAYKCQEYSLGIYKIIPKKSFKFINLREKVSEGSELHKALFGDKEKETELWALRNQLERCSNIQEYEYLDNEIEKTKKETDGILKYNKDMFLATIRHYNIDNLGQLQYFVNNPNKYLPVLAKGLLQLGYDGGYYDGVYTVWNFDKLNNLVQTITLKDGK